ncbi:MAG: 3-oxoacyl-[acyl-carrier-protein] reductase [Candidatus Latescibacteria bacterium]|nr:3-oxoacyl-[acyl-carrier-protein] reductase [Candidatus Latescibacterota bacterium]
MSGRLDGRVAVVTGGAKGIGRAIAARLAREGAKVVISGREEAALRTACAELGEGGGGAAWVRADVASPDDTEALCAKTLETFGKADILVNNAGVTRDNLVMRMSEREWDEVIDTNLKGSFLCIRAFARPMMKQRWGRIVNVSSVVGLIGNPGQANYVASKAGLLGLTKAVAKELASRHITVNAVAPGFIDTAMTAELGGKVRDELQGRIPLGRLGTPEDVAHAVAFLCSEEAGYITGQVLSVDGGMRM